MLLNCAFEVLFSTESIRSEVSNPTPLDLLFYKVSFFDAGVRYPSLQLKQMHHGLKMEWEMKKKS